LEVDPSQYLQWLKDPDDVLLEAEDVMCSGKKQAFLRIVVLRVR